MINFLFDALGLYLNVYLMPLGLYLYVYLMPMHVTTGTPPPACLDGLLSSMTHLVQVCAGAKDGVGGIGLKIFSLEVVSIVRVALRAESSTGGVMGNLPISHRKSGNVNSSPYVGNLPG